MIITYIHIVAVHHVRLSQVRGRGAGALSGDVGSRRKGAGLERHPLFIPDLLHLRGVDPEVGASAGGAENHTQLT